MLQVRERSAWKLREIDEGDMLVIVAFGYALTTNQVVTFGDQVV